MTRIKICGLTQLEHAVVAAEAGADLVGMVFAESRRRVTVEQARAICDAVRAVRPVCETLSGGRRLAGRPEMEEYIDGLRPALVGVFAGYSAEEVNRIAKACGLDFVQLAGEEPWEFVVQIERPVLYVRHVNAGDDVASLRRRLPEDLASFTQLNPILHLDSGSPSVSGGTGVTIPWAVAAALAREAPLVLAGGLTPENVGEAIERVHPWCVDVSSGVETGGVKDVNRIQAFVAVVRRQDAVMSAVAEMERAV